MTSIAGLERRIRRVVSQLEPEHKTWVFALEPGEEIPPEIAARIRPHDTVSIQELPCNYFSGLEEEEAEVGSS